MAYINWSDVSNFTAVVQAANTGSNNTFWIGMLFMLWIVLILVLLIHGFEAALIASSFIALILGVLMTYADLINWQYNLIFLGVLLGMFLYVTYATPQRV